MELTESVEQLCTKLENHCMEKTKYFINIV